MTVEEEVLLGPLTTFQIGGPARFFTRIESVEDLRLADAFAKERNLPSLVLGGGSNTLFDDAEYPGLVMAIVSCGISIERHGDAALLIAEAGEAWDGVVSRAVEEGLWGIENLSGIPGTFGAAPVQNIGAYGAEVSKTLAWVEVFDRERGIVERVEGSACGFGYRTSRFKREPGRFIIVRGALELAAEGEPNLSYTDLHEAFSGKRPSLSEMRTAVCAIRSRKFPDLSKEGTAGSFFLNPVVSAEKAKELSIRTPGLPRYSEEGGVKVSLAYLLDKGLGLKGLRRGKARLFERQPLVIVAARGAASRDVRALCDEVKQQVLRAYGIALEEEVRII